MEKPEAFAVKKEWSTVPRYLSTQTLRFVEYLGIDFECSILSACNHPR